MNIGWPETILLCLMVTGAVMTRTLAAFAGAMVVLALLWWGGFFA